MVIFLKVTMRVSWMRSNYRLNYVVTIPYLTFLMEWRVFSVYKLKHVLYWRSSYKIVVEEFYIISNTETFIQLQLFIVYHLYRLNEPTRAAGFSGSSFFLVPSMSVTFSQAQQRASSIQTISMKPPPTSSATNTMIWKHLTQGNQPQSSAKTSNNNGRLENKVSKWV